MPDTKTETIDKILARLTARNPELASCEESVRAAFTLCRDTYERGGKLLLCGNGGSAADCAHIAGELMKGFYKSRPMDREFIAGVAARFGQENAARLRALQGGLPAVPLTESSALLSAFSNDTDPELCFAQQVIGLGKPGDALIGISTSGNAKNVCFAAMTAAARGVNVLALTGSEGGKLAGLADVAICVPAFTTADVQELHLPVYHAICEMLEEWFFET